MDTIRVATQPYMWNQTYRRQGADYLDHLEEWLSLTRAAGVGFVALNEAMFQRDGGTETLAAALAAAGMRPVDCFVSGPCHREADAEATVEAVTATARQAQSVGATAITINPLLFPDRVKTDAELVCQAKTLDRLAQALTAFDLPLQIHNHGPEMKQNAREFIHNLEHTDPNRLFLNYDVHWAAFGGADELGLLRRYVSRVRELHLRQWKDGEILEVLGDGDLDYREVARILRDAGFAGTLSIELENRSRLTPSAVAENLRLSREYVAEVFGV